MRQPARVSGARLSAIVGLAAFAVIAPGPGAHARPALPAAGALEVQPFPGTPDASPHAVIAFPALTAEQITALTVTGSRSGRHRGHLSPLPAGHGISFVPQRPFAAGERVSVQAMLNSVEAGTASGAPRERQIGFSFTVATQVQAAGSPAASVANGPPLNNQVQSFHSENWLHPPTVSVSGIDPDPSLGDIFADAENSIQSGPLILDPQGRLIYFQPLTRSAAFNVEVQSYQGQSVLTYWQGYVRYGVGIGRDVILNHAYEPVATVYAGNGYSADLHEFQITPQGDALITAYSPVRADLSSVGGPRKGTLMDSIIQEIDIATGKVLWEWHADGHVRLTQSYASLVPGRPYDYFHINSIQQLPNGNLLISARETWALYEINMKTGRIVLAIGGKRSSFRMGPGTNFEWQHDAHMQPDGTITLFDNATDGSSYNERRSRALRLRLNFRRRRVTLLAAYTSHPPQLATSQGDVQALADGDTFVGWGAAPYLTEYGWAGHQRFSVHFPWPVQSYRGYRFQWLGQPTTPPSIAATTTTQGATVYASWNGATQVASWQVLAGPGAGAMSPIGQFPDNGFETTMSVSTIQPYLEVQALDSAGNVLGTSAVVAR